MPATLSYTEEQGGDSQRLLCLPAAAPWSLIVFSVGSKEPEKAVGWAFTVYVDKKKAEEASDRLGTWALYRQ
ncbi:hypothetical protein PG994_008250 [Apiospora phragmitis]|uniref:Uncharacterized protein n=1 Tax=Apiospora phragmitis TaxID=2905665 RepID=A0ABR1USI0_9PEZI